MGHNKRLEQKLGRMPAAKSTGYSIMTSVYVGGSGKPHSAGLDMQHGETSSHDQTLNDEVEKAQAIDHFTRPLAELGADEQFIALAMPTPKAIQGSSTNAHGVNSTTIHDHLNPKIRSETLPPPRQMKKLPKLYIPSPRTGWRDPPPSMSPRVVKTSTSAISPLSAHGDFPTPLETQDLTGSMPAIDNDVMMVDDDVRASSDEASETKGLQSQEEYKKALEDINGTYPQMQGLPGQMPDADDDAMMEDVDMQDATGVASGHAGHAPEEETERQATCSVS